MSVEERNQENAKGIISINAGLISVPDLPDAPEPPDSTATARPLISTTVTPLRDSNKSPSSPAVSATNTTAAAVASAGDGPTLRPNHVRTVMLNGVPIVALVIDGKERLCLAQISNTLLKNFSYNEIHNRRVALGITCVQCTPVQLEILRRAGAMPISSRRCGMITKREAERLCKSFLTENAPPKLPENFAFEVFHACSWGCRGSFMPSRYNSSRAKCIKCGYCNLFFSPNKFIFHSHRLQDSKYTQPDAANFNSWRRHLKLSGDPNEETVHAWEDVKAMFNGGSRRRVMVAATSGSSSHGGGGRFHLIKRSRVDDPTATQDNSVVVGSGGPPSATPTEKNPYLPVIPFPNKNYGLPPPPQGPPPPPYLRSAPNPLGPPDIRQGFAEYMWGSKQAAFPPAAAAAYGFVWSPRGGELSPSSSTSSSYFDKSKDALLPPSSKGDVDGIDGISDRASDLGSTPACTPPRRPLSSCSEHDARDSEADDGGGGGGGVGLVFRRNIAQKRSYLSAFRPVVRSGVGPGGPPPNLQGLLTQRGSPPPPLRPEPAFADDGRVTSTRTDRDSVASSTALISSSDGENVDIEMTDDDERSRDASSFLTTPTRPDHPPSPPPSLVPMIDSRLAIANNKPLGLIVDDSQTHKPQVPDSALPLASPGERTSPTSVLPGNGSPLLPETIIKGKQNDCDMQRFSALTKEEMEEMFVQEKQARRRAEKECQIMQESFQEQVKREVASYREEFTKQLHLVRGRDVARSLCISAPIDALPRVGPREEGEICRIAETQRGSRRPPPLLMQDVNFAAMYRMRLQADPTAAMSHMFPAAYPRKPCDCCHGNKPRDPVLAHSAANLPDHFRLHPFPQPNEMLGSNWAL